VRGGAWAIGPTLVRTNDTGVGAGTGVPATGCAVTIPVVRGTAGAKDAGRAVDWAECGAWPSIRPDGAQPFWFARG
jgi:hypothetical protein